MPATFALVGDRLASGYVGRAGGTAGMRVVELAERVAVLESCFVSFGGWGEDWGLVQLCLTVCFLFCIWRLGVAGKGA